MFVRKACAMPHPADLAESPTPDRFLALDSWRGIAALGVAYYHIRGIYWWLDGPFYIRLDFAVDFFFVLSGFVIAAAYGDKLRQGFGIGKFMFLRYMRLWPLHVFVIGLLVAMELVFLALGSFEGLAGREPFGFRREWWTLPATLALVQDYLHPGLRPWNSASWSISIEVGLYLMAALLWRGFGRWGTGVALAIALAAGVALLGAEERASMDILRGLAGFGLGMALYELWLRVRGFALTAAWASLAEIALVVLMVLTIIYLPVRGVADLVFAALILAFAFERGVLSRLLLMPGFFWLGTLSYSIYLVHGFVIGRSYDALIVLQSLTGWELVSQRGRVAMLVMHPALGALAMAAMLAGSVLAAYFTWRWIEEPARRWSKRKAAAWGAPEAERRAPWK